MLYNAGHLRRALSAAVASVVILGAGQVAAAEAAPTFTFSGSALTSAVVGSPRPST